jgi:glyoxylase-like metal-dependent hydrolase (beta-lactamase superfamily II)
MPTSQTLHWERYESALWSTTSILVVAESESVVVDPCITSDEIAVIDARASALGAPVSHVLITHGDWDHVCGIAAFPTAVATMGEGTAKRIESGEAAEAVRAGVDEYRITVVPGTPRVDRTVTQGSAFLAGPFVVETLGLAGHTADGTAYRFRDLGLLAVGDYLSPGEFPFASSPAAYRMTLAGLIELLRHDPPTTVIPGHGRPLDPDEALAIAEADLDYLRSLHSAVVAALEAGGDRGRALAAGLEVALPRQAPPDLAILRTLNVERQLDEILAPADDG